MKRSRLALTLATAAVIATGCAAQQVPAAAGTTSSAAGTSTAAKTSGSVMTTASPSSRVAVSGTSPMATGSSSAAADGFLRLARTVYPTRSAAVLIQNGRAICTALRKDSSVHDEVNTLAGELNDQAIANQVVQAAIGAYCPDLKR